MFPGTRGYTWGKPGREEHLAGTSSILRGLCWFVPAVTERSETMAGAREKGNPIRPVSVGLRSDCVAKIVLLKEHVAGVLREGGLLENVHQLR